MLEPNNPLNECRVLSIQSHVVCGFVGNKSAVFPLQALGLEVDMINSVQFSNHTGYKSMKGQILKSSELDDLIDGLRSNDLLNYTHLLTGYMGDPTFLNKVCDVVGELKRINPKLIYVCDPVMGDNNRMYVPESLLPIYKEKVVPLADIITPNQFEAELLTDIKINNKQDAIKAMDILHNKGVQTVVISSSALGSEDVLIGLGSSVQNGGMKKGICIEIPRIAANFTGTGDLFAALLLAWLHKHPANLKLSCEKVISTMQVILRRTLDHAIKQVKPGEKPNCHHLELKLVQSLEDILHPNVCITAQDM